jgi:hypothetical protein
VKPIPAKDAFGKVCDDCGYCFNSPETQEDHCQLFVDPITGQEALCKEARAYDDICGPEAKHFERRRNISAIVEDAPITVEYESATATGNEALVVNENRIFRQNPDGSLTQIEAENEHAKSYVLNHPEIMNRIHGSDIHDQFMKEADKDLARQLLEGSAFTNDPQINEAVRKARENDKLKPFTDYKPE